MELKSVKLKKKVYNSLKKLKIHPRESFNDVIERKIKNVQKRPKPMTRHRHQANSKKNKEVGLYKL